MTGEFSGGSPETLATGEQLTAHVDELVANGDQQFSGHPLMKDMAGLLAKRIGDHGVVPMGYVMATELLITDVQRNKDGFTGEPMPHQVVGFLPIMGGLFRIEAQRLATGAFGEQFGQEVKQIYDETLGGSQEQ